MVGQQLTQTNEKCYSVPQCPMWLFLPLFYGSKHTPYICICLQVREIGGGGVDTVMVSMTCVHGLLISTNSVSHWPPQFSTRGPFASRRRRWWQQSDYPPPTMKATAPHLHLQLWDVTLLGKSFWSAPCQISCHCPIPIAYDLLLNA